MNAYEETLTILTAGALAIITIGALILLKWAGV